VNVYEVVSCSRRFRDFGELPAARDQFENY
jgi:hypothetical protein